MVGDISIIHGLELPDIPDVSSGGAGLIQAIRDFYGCELTRLAPPTNDKPHTTMRFEPDQDPNPERSKYRTISDYSEMPDEYKSMHLEIYNQAIVMAEGARSTEKLTKTEAVLHYAAFQGVQIKSLQDEIRVIYKGLNVVADELELKQNKQD